MKPESKPKPVNNIADVNKPMWKGVAARPQGRCLIPVTDFAEPEGPKGAKTRTWVTIKGQPIIAWAGLWRDSGEWGLVYSGAMTNANDDIAPLHDRMPVFLFPDEYDKWLHGTLDDLLTFQNRKFPSGLMEMDRTSELWVPRKPSSEKDAPAKKLAKA